ncbi:hypothetical protein GCM10011247_40720 [Pseudomonas plecoglossicida]|nr:hypothetical protein GCM10011247_40720 [Pseudomonas plecoglossicida]
MIILRDAALSIANVAEEILMNLTLQMGGGNAQDDWPELDPEQRNDRADDPDTDPNVADDDQNRPGVPASDPESGA